MSGALAEHTKSFGPITLACGLGTQNCVLLRAQTIELFSLLPKAYLSGVHAQKGGNAQRKQVPPGIDQPRDHDRHRERLGLRGRQRQANPRLPQCVEDAQLPAHLHYAVARERIRAAECPAVTCSLKWQHQHVFS